MENNLHIDFKAHEEISDTLSTSAASVTHNPFEETSPSQHSTLDNDVQAKSRKIRKKRDAYKKIDDEIRLHLLEAVQRGETLKSAAKRYQVNYSSAKSIFHIYRKEGRILKKATQEKDFTGNPVNNMSPMNPMTQMNPMSTMNTMNTANIMNMATMNPLGTGIQIPLQFPQMPQNPTQIPMIPFYQRSIFPQAYIPQDLSQLRQMPTTGNEGSGCSSPLNNLVDNFSELLKIGTNMNPMNSKDDMLKQKSFMPTNPSRFMPRTSSPTNLNKIQPNQQQQQQHIILASKPLNNPGFGSPAGQVERKNTFDNFYMNYSNSPLSGNARMMKEGSESGSNRHIQGEFDSFSDMVSAFQTQNHLANTIKERQMSKFMTPGVGTPKEKNNERKMSSEEEVWNGNIENAALDTYKSFLDAQMVLSNAFMKASVLNNMVQFQKSKMEGSPSSKFLNFIGN